MSESADDRYALAMGRAIVAQEKYSALVDRLKKIAADIEDATDAKFDEPWPTQQEAKEAHAALMAAMTEVNKADYARTHHKT